MKIIYLFLIIILGINIANAQPRKQDPKAQANRAANPVTDAPQVTSPIETMTGSNAESAAYRKERDDKDDAFRAQQTEQNEIIKNANWWVAVFAGFSIIFAFVLAAVNILQWRQAKTLFDLADRPSLGMRGQPVMHQMESGRHLIINIKNTGKSPAVDVQIQFTKDAIKKSKVPLKACPEPKKGTILDRIKSRGVIAINGTSQLISEPAISTPEWSQISSGEQVLFVWAVITYRKTLIQRGAPYRWEYYARFNPELKCFVQCDTHNDAT